MKREEELITGDDNLAYNMGLEIRYAIAASGVDPIQHIPEVDEIIKRRISEIRTLANSPKPVGWETDAEWDLEMRCANITEATPFAEVSKLINDLWQQYCLVAEPKPEAEGGAHVFCAMLTTGVCNLAEENERLRSALEEIRDQAALHAVDLRCTCTPEQMLSEARLIARAAITAKQNDGREEE